MAIEETDDGTMDTVVRCDICGEEFRFNYDPSMDDAEIDADDEQACMEAYDAWIDGCIEEMEVEHDCQGDKR